MVFDLDNAVAAFVLVDRTVGLVGEFDVASGRTVDDSVDDSVEFDPVSALFDRGPSRTL